jgi:hypothetical protein
MANIKDLCQQVLRAIKHEKFVILKSEPVVIESKIESEFDYSPLEREFREKLRKASINKENA